MQHACRLNNKVGALKKQKTKQSWEKRAKAFLTNVMLVNNSSGTIYKYGEFVLSDMPGWGPA